MNLLKPKKPDPTELLHFRDTDNQHRYIRRDCISTVNDNSTGSVWLTLTGGRDVWLLRDAYIVDRVVELVYKGNK